MNRKTDHPRTGLLRGAAYYPEHRDPRRWEEDLRRMAEAHLNVVRVGEFAWKLFEPQDGRYSFEWLDEFNELAAGQGIGLLLCPPLRTLPAWLVQRDETLRLQREDGVRLTFGSRYSFCTNHPLLQSKGLALAAALARHFGDSSNVLGWHLDNEMGDEPDCHCSYCAAAFRDWCRRRYGGIEALNRAWGTVFWGLEFDCFDQVPTPAVTKAWTNPGLLLAWRRFRSQATVELAARMADAVRRCCATGQWITTNHQMWNMRTDYYAMGRMLDFSGLNYYPEYGRGGMQRGFELARCRGYRQAPFQVHELRNGPHMIPGRAGNQPAPGEVQRLAMQCFAHGSDGTFFFRWKACPFGAEQGHGTLTDYDGQPLRVYREVQQLYRRLAAMEESLAGTGVTRQTAILFDFPTEWLTGQKNPWLGKGKHQQDIAQRCYSALQSARYAVDVVGSQSDWTPYRMLVVPLTTMVDDSLAAAMTSYVKAGGTLVLHPLCGLRDAEAWIYPQRLHPELQELLGIRLKDFITAVDPLPFRWNDNDWEGTDFRECPEMESAAAHGRFEDPRGPVWTSRQQGKGNAVFLCTYGSEAFYRTWLAQLAAGRGLEPLVAANLPEGVEVTQREGKQGKFLFLLNGSNRRLELQWPNPARDLYRQQQLNGRLELQPFGVAVLGEEG